MKVSLIIPTLNEAAHIEHTLKALAPLRVFNKSDQLVEIILVDGGSNDATISLATPLCDQVLQSPKGRSLQMNAGAAAATGDLLLFLHADTQLTIRAIEVVQMAAVTASPRTIWGRFDVTIQGTHSMLPVVAWFMNTRSRLTRIATGDQAIFVSKSLFDSIGGFAPIALMEDVELCSRLKNTLASFIALKDRVETSGRRWEKKGVFRTIFLMWQLRFAFWRGAATESLRQKYES